MDAGNPLLDDYVLRLTGVERPRVCFVPTASGDADHYVVRFYRTFAAFGCEPSHLSLFRRDRTRGDRRPGEHLLKQDLIYVGGGSVISLLGAWRAHGIDLALSEAWRRGIVLCGLSAGSLCWFSEAVTAFHGPPQAVEGLGLLPHSNCVHYDGEPWRRQEYRRFVRDGMCAGYAADDGAALHFVGTDLHRVVASRPGKRGWRVALRGDRVVERKLATVDLGAPLRAGRVRTILALGGGGFTAPPGDPALDELVLAAGREPGAADPLPADRQRRPARPDRRASTPPSATGRASRRCSRSSAGRPAPPAARHRARPGRHLRRRRLDAQPAAPCGGARPRRLLRDAWERGVVLAGLSAGAMCWFERRRDDVGGRARADAGPGPAARAR